MGNVLLLLLLAGGVTVSGLFAVLAIASATKAAEHEGAAKFYAWKAKNPHARPTIGSGDDQ